MFLFCDFDVGNITLSDGEAFIGLKHPDFNGRNQVRILALEGYKDGNIYLYWLIA